MHAQILSGKQAPNDYSGLKVPQQITYNRACEKTKPTHLYSLFLFGCCLVSNNGHDVLDSQNKQDSSTCQIGGLNEAVALPISITQSDYRYHE